MGSGLTLILHGLSLIEIKELLDSNLIAGALKLWSSATIPTFF